MRIKKFPKLTPLLIIWDDIKSDSRWTDLRGIEDAKPSKIRTLGFYLGTKKRVLKIAHSITDDNESDFTVIPWGCVEEIKELREVE